MRARRLGECNCRRLFGGSAPCSCTEVHNGLNETHPGPTIAPPASGSADQRLVPACHIRQTDNPGMLADGVDTAVITCPNPHSYAACSPPVLPPPPTPQRCGWLWHRLPQAPKQPKTRPLSTCLLRAQWQACLKPGRKLYWRGAGEALVSIGVGSERGGGGV